jgi:hypothetical protein
LPPLAANVLFFFSPSRGDPRDDACLPAQNDIHAHGAKNTPTENHLEREGIFTFQRSSPFVRFYPKLHPRLFKEISMREKGLVSPAQRISFHPPKS